MSVHSKLNRRGGKRGGNQQIRRSPHRWQKIADPITAVLYAFALDEADFYSNDYGGGWTAKIEGIKAAELRAFYADEFGFLNRAERKEILSYQGFIFFEDSQGDLMYTGYGYKDYLKEQWRELESHYGYDED